MSILGFSTKTTLETAKIAVKSGITKGEVILANAKNSKTIIIVIGAIALLIVAYLMFKRK